MFEKCEVRNVTGHFPSKGGAEKNLSASLIYFATGRTAIHENTRGFFGSPSKSKHCYKGRGDTEQS